MRPPGTRPILLAWLVIAFATIILTRAQRNALPDTTTTHSEDAQGTPAHGISGGGRRNAPVNPAAAGQDAPLLAFPHSNAPTVLAGGVQQHLGVEVASGTESAPEDSAEPDTSAHAPTFLPLGPSLNVLPPHWTIRHPSLLRRIFAPITQLLGYLLHTTPDPPPRYIASDLARPERDPSPPSSHTAEQVTQHGGTSGGDESAAAAVRGRVLDAEEVAEDGCRLGDTHHRESCVEDEEDEGEMTEDGGGEGVKVERVGHHVAEPVVKADSLSLRSGLAGAARDYTTSAKAIGRWLRRFDPLSSVTHYQAPSPQNGDKDSHVGDPVDQSPSSDKSSVGSSSSQAVWQQTSEAGGHGAAHHLSPRIGSEAPPIGPEQANDREGHPSGSQNCFKRSGPLLLRICTHAALCCVLHLIWAAGRFEKQDTRLDVVAGQRNGSKILAPGSYPHVAVAQAVNLVIEERAEKVASTPPVLASPELGPRLFTSTSSLLNWVTSSALGKSLLGRNSTSLQGVQTQLQDEVGFDVDKKVLEEVATPEIVCSMEAIATPSVQHRVESRVPPPQPVESTTQSSRGSPQPSIDERKCTAEEHEQILSLLRMLLESQSDIKADLKRLLEGNVGLEAVPGGILVKMPDMVAEQVTRNLQALLATQSQANATQLADFLRVCDHNRLDLAVEVASAVQLRIRREGEHQSLDNLALIKLVSGLVQAALATLIDQLPMLLLQAQDIHSSVPPVASTAGAAPPSNNSQAIQSTTPTGSPPSNAYKRVGHAKKQSSSGKKTHTRAHNTPYGGIKNERASLESARRTRRRLFTSVDFATPPRLSGNPYSPPVLGHLQTPTPSGATSHPHLGTTMYHDSPDRATHRVSRETLAAPMR